MTSEYKYDQLKTEKFFEATVQNYTAGFEMKQRQQVKYATM